MDNPTSTRTASGSRGDCPCEGKTLERFLRPAILIVVAREPQYGYKIVQCLSEMPIFAGQKPNAAGVYRCLHTMADEGLVVSSWELSEVGPAKRLFTLTRAGESCLASWLMTLIRYRDELDSLLTLGQEVIARWREEAATTP